jgi:hypothetical protein
MQYSQAPRRDGKLARDGLIFRSRSVESSIRKSESLGEETENRGEDEMER